jgi:hypothetical protein
VSGNFETLFWLAPMDEEEFFPHQAEILNLTYNAGFKAI